MRGGGVSHQLVQTGEDLVPVRVEQVERARTGQHFQRALAHPLQIDPAGEVEQVEEGLVRAVRPPRIRYQAHRLDPDVFQTAQGVDDLPVLDRERRLGAVDARRDQTDFQAVDLLLVDAELVGQVDVAIHHAGHEFDRVVRLEPCRLIADHGIGGGVGFVEAVIGELVQQIPDLLRLGLIHVVFGSTGQEFRALGVHCLLNLLAHRAAQHIGTAQRIAGHVLRDLHHLLLIDDDALRLIQDMIDGGVQQGALLAPVLHVAEGRDILHRARTVEGDQRDDILDAGGLHLAQGVAHA